MSAAWSTTDEGLAEYVYRTSTVYRSGGAYGSAIRERSEHLAHLATMAVLTAGSLREAVVWDRRGGTPETAVYAARALGTHLRWWCELQDALHAEVRTLRVPSCDGCGEALSHSRADGWHCDRIGCGDGVEWLETQVRRRGGGR